MNEQLKDALNTLIDIKDASGLNRKKELLENRRDNETLKDILYFVFNPYIKTGIGWSKLNKLKSDWELERGMTIQNVFSYLQDNHTGRDEDIIYVLSFINSQDEKLRPILEEIFTKSMKLGISTTTIHKVWPNLIPGFGVQLACKLEDNIQFLEGKTIFITEKLDGNRCFARVKNHECTFYSRSGREIEGLDDVAEELSRLIDGWYDGELLASNFSQTQSIARTKGKKKNLVFNIFDYVTDNEVQKQEGEISYFNRRKELNKIFDGLEKIQNIALVPLIRAETFDIERVVELLDKYTKNGSEGIMINTDEPYNFNRNPNLIKCKKMYTLDLRVTGVTEGRGEFANMAGALLVDYKGYTVGVGSGIDKNERIRFWCNKENIIGKIITVQAFEETKDQNGNLSLRFPVFKGVREDKEEESYD